MIQNLERPVEAIDFYFNPRASYYPGEDAIRGQAEDLARRFELTTGEIALIDQKPSPGLFTERHDIANPVARVSVTKGGDRSATDLVEATLAYLGQKRLLSEPVPYAPVLGLDGTGNGLNLHTSLNGKRFARNLLGLLASGQAAVGELHPMLVTFPNGKTTASTSIVGLGGTAVVNDVYHDRREQWKNTRRGIRIVKEMALADLTYGDYATQFMLETDHPELAELVHGRWLSGFDELIAKRIAKNGRVPIKPLSDEAFAMVTELPGNRFGRMAKAAMLGARFAVNRPPGGKFIFEPGTKHRLTVVEATEPVDTQIDGDKTDTLIVGDMMTLGRSSVSARVIYNSAAIR